MQLLPLALKYFLVPIMASWGLPTDPLRAVQSYSDVLRIYVMHTYFLAYYC